MLNAKEILEENLIVLDNAKGKPAQVGYDLSIKSISKLKGGGKVLKDKTIVNKLDEVSFNESDNGWWIGGSLSLILIYWGAPFSLISLLLVMAMYSWQGVGLLFYTLVSVLLLFNLPIIRRYVLGWPVFRLLKSLNILPQEQYYLSHLYIFFLSLLINKTSGFLGSYQGLPFPR